MEEKVLLDENGIRVTTSRICCCFTESFFWKVLLGVVLVLFWPVILIIWMIGGGIGFPGPLGLNIGVPLPRAE